MQTLLGRVERWLAYSQKPLENSAGEKVNDLTQLLVQSDKPVGTKKCSKCGEVKPSTFFSKDKSKKDNLTYWCKKCTKNGQHEYRNTERGYLRMKYVSMSTKEFSKHRYGRRSKCFINFKELWAAWEKHKSIYGMKSAWGPGPDRLEEHLPITMIREGKGQLGKKGCIKGSKRIPSNLSIDRLDPNLDYTVQNIIFIRGDENARKNATTYGDCKIQMRLHEERFKDEME